MIDVIANTIYGKVRGEYGDGVYRFLGIRYAKPPVGELRFLPPQKPDTSTLITDAKQYALKCYQTDTPRIEVPEIANSHANMVNQQLMAGNMELGKGPQSEDCLALNIWTKALYRGAKLPVLIWCHGGGNVAGTGEAPWHDGTVMASKNDVVMVTFSHRLGPFGYMDLTHLGVEKYAGSVNVGHLDIVAMLEWVRDNIEWFGGDPDNVTIFGESGGGGKVAQLLVTPGARGLFHRAIIQSGGFRADPPEVGQADTDALLDELGIGVSNIDELSKISPERIIEAVRAINAGRENGNYLNFPVLMDGKVIACDPFDGGAGTELNRDVPLIICYTKHDMALLALFNPEIFDLTFEELPKKIQDAGFSEEEAKELIDIYRNILDGPVSAADIFIALLNDNHQLMFVDRVSRAREKVGCAPFYNCVFSFESPDPVQKAIHGTDVPFFFDNVYLAPGLYTAENREEAYRLSDTCGSSFAGYAKTGNPTGRNMPDWLPYDQKDRYTMLFKERSELVSDYRSPIREILTDRDLRVPGFGKAKK